MHRLLFQLLEHPEGVKRYGPAAGLIRQEFENLKRTTRAFVGKRLNALHQAHQEQGPNVKSKDRRQYNKVLRALRDVRAHWNAIEWMEDLKEQCALEKPNARQALDGVVGDLPAPEALFATPQKAVEKYADALLKRARRREDAVAVVTLEQRVLPDVWALWRSRQ